MYYQVWSKGVLIGHADLGYGEMTLRARVGSFYPNSAGQPLMSLFSDITRAHRAARKAQGSPPVGDEPPRPSEEWDTCYADIMSAHLRAESLDLELRRMDGTTVATEYITMRDLHEVLAFNTLCAEGDGPLCWLDESEDDDAWRGDEAEGAPDADGLSRYHISIELTRGDSIP